MKNKNKFACCLMTLTFAGSAHAATIATRVSVDSIVGQHMTAGSTGYFTDPNASTVGVTGSAPSGSRRNIDVVYRYTLPTLNPGESIESFKFSFQITSVRDDLSSGRRNPELDVYLLDVVDPTTTGTSLFYRGDTSGNPNDAAHAFVGSSFVETNVITQVTLDPALDVTFTINSGPALTLLQGFYGGDHIPDQTEASFRFNLDRIGAPPFDEGDGIIRYAVNNDVATSGFEITAIPEPSAALLGGLGLLALLRRRR